jgi:hypothetical protein
MIIVYREIVCREATMKENRHKQASKNFSDLNIAYNDKSSDITSMNGTCSEAITQLCNLINISDTFIIVFNLTLANINKNYL